MITQSVLDRFWRQTNVSTPDACWPWIKGKGSYGTFSFQGKPILAHRFTLWATTGTKPKGLVCHRCDNPPCVNPAHLFEGSHKDNTQDAKSKHRLASGSRQGLATLDESQVETVHRLYGDGNNCNEIAALFDVHKSTVARAIRGQTYRRENYAPRKLRRRDRPHAKARCSDCGLVVSVSTTGRLRAHGFTKRGTSFQTEQRCLGIAEVIE